MSVRGSSLSRVLFLAFLFSSWQMYAQHHILIDPYIVLGDVSSRPVGINVNYWEDDQSRRPVGSKELSTVLKNMGVKYLRYPGGEKSDGYLWSTASVGYTQPNPRLGRISLQDWPSRDSTYWWPVGDPAGNWARAVYDFDEFMKTCQAVGGKPVIVLAYDGIYKPAAPGGYQYNFQEAMAAAKNWVKYANVVKGYGIKYWTIGNETYLPGYFGGEVSAIQYGKDAAKFAIELKKIDPTIKVGINGETTEWFDQALPYCAEYIDFLDVHTYPCYQYASYNDYLNAEPTPIPGIASAKAAISKLSPADRQRIAITLSETSALSFGEGLWDAEGANTGHGLATFEIMAKAISEPGVAYSLFWNTRWIDNHLKKPQVTDALFKNNRVNAQGLALKLLFTNLLKNMVYAANPSTAVTIQSYASFDPKTGALHVWVVNKARSAAPVTIQVKGTIASAKAQRYLYAGSSEKDDYPTTQRKSDLTVNNNMVQFNAAPVSISLIKMMLSPANIVNAVANHGFEINSPVQSPPGWSTWSTSSSDADYTEAGGYKGNYQLGHWKASAYQVYTYQPLKNLPNGKYTLSAWVRCGGGQNEASMLAKNNGEERKAVIPSTNYWKLIQITDINVSSGTCEIGFYSDAKAGQWLHVDEVSFLKSGEVSQVALRQINQAETEISLPDDQAFPNPFKESVSIPVSLEKFQEAEIFIYSLYGALVRKFVKVGHEINGNTILWDGLDHRGNPVSKGMYIYKIRIGNKIQEGKLVKMEDG